MHQYVFKENLLCAEVMMIVQKGTPVNMDDVLSFGKANPETCPLSRTQKAKVTYP